MSAPVLDVVAAAGFVAACVARASVVLAAAAIGARLARRRPAAVRHALWAAAIVGCLAVPLAAATLPPLLPPLDALRPAVAAPAPVASDPRAHAAGARRASGAWLDTVGDDGPTVDGRPRLAAALLACWALGAATLLARLTAAQWRAGALVRRARPVRAPATLAALRALAGRDRSLARVALLESDEVRAPVAAGLWRGVVVLPRRADPWTGAELRAVLAHELAHVARRDCLVELAVQVACALHWCTPLVWLAAARLAHERERACDDRVLAAGVSPVRYAELLLATARAARRDAPVGALALARPGTLERRLVAILDAQTPRAAGAGAARVTTVLAAGVVVALSATVPLHAAPARRPAVPPEARVEPDLRGDSIAGPLSERLPARVALVPLSAALASGPDAALARRLASNAERAPTWEGDLVPERSRWALARSRDGRLVEPMADALDDRDWRVRAYAAWTLAEAGADARRDPRVAPALERALADPVWRLRAMAAAALAALGDPRSAPALARALDDAAWQVRVGAVAYLDAHGGPAARPLLRAALHDPHTAVHSAAESALAGAPSS